MLSFVQYSDKCSKTTINASGASNIAAITTIKNLTCNTFWTLAGGYKSVATLHYLQFPILDEDGNVDYPCVLKHNQSGMSLSLEGPNQTNPCPYTHITLTAGGSHIESGSIIANLGVALLDSRFYGEFRVGMWQWNASSEALEKISNSYYTIVIWAKESGPEYNNISCDIYSPHQAAPGDITTHGGWLLKCKQYYNSVFQLAIKDHNGSLWLKFYSNTSFQYTMAQQTNYTVICNPYQLAIFITNRNDDGEFTADSRKRYNSVFMTCPYIETTVTSVRKLVMMIYRIPGAVNFRDVMYSDRQTILNIDNLTWSGTPTFTRQDSAWAVPTLRSTKNILSETESGSEESIVSPAYLAVNSNLILSTAECRIIGYIWDSFTVTKWYDWGTIVNKDDKQWELLMSQREDIGPNASSVFLRNN